MLDAFCPLQESHKKDEREKFLVPPRDAESCRKSFSSCYIFLPPTRMNGSPERTGARLSGEKALSVLNYAQIDKYEKMSPPLLPGVGGEGKGGRTR